MARDRKRCRPASIVAIIENQPHRIVSDRLNGCDGHILLAGLQRFLSRAMALHFGARRMHAQVFEGVIEGCTIVEGDDEQPGILAEVAFQVNENTENIGARRLHTVMERLLETVSFEASDKSGTHVQIDAGYVDDHLAELSKDEDLSRYIL